MVFAHYSEITASHGALRNKTLFQSPVLRQNIESCQALHVMRELGITLQGPCNLYCDNTSVLHMTISDKFHAKTKHLRDRSSLYKRESSHRRNYNQICTFTRTNG